MESLSCHLMWVAAATYCSVLAPKGLLATLIGVLGMAHFSLGRGSGSFFGGFLIGNLGTREAFRYMGLMAVVGGFMYFGLDLIYLRRFDATNDDKDEEEMDKGEAEKLTEPKTRDQGTTMSQERLSLWVKYNQIGSLASLPRGSKVIYDKNHSEQIEMMKLMKTTSINLSHTVFHTVYEVRITKILSSI